MATVRGADTQGPGQRDGGEVAGLEQSLRAAVGETGGAARPILLVVSERRLPRSPLRDALSLLGYRVVHTRPSAASEVVRAILVRLVVTDDSITAEEAYEIASTLRRRDQTIAVLTFGESDVKNYDAGSVRE